MARTRSQRAVPLLVIVVAVVLLTARLAAHFFTPEKPKNDLVHWVPLEEVGTRAAATNKIVLIDFTAEWCSPCHLLDDQVFRDPAMAREINARFIALRITDREREDGRNSPQVEQLQRRYSVSSFPTVIFIDADGTERARMEGYGGPEQFRRVMESIR